MAGPDALGCLSDYEARTVQAEGCLHATKLECPSDAPLEASQTKVWREPTHRCDGETKVQRLRSNIPLLSQFASRRSRQRHAHRSITFITFAEMNFDICDEPGIRGLPIKRAA
jgi:hypothetical protein